MIRVEDPSDIEAIYEVNRLAFGRNDEARLVDALRDKGYSRVSLVADVDGEVVGHILFSDLTIITTGGPVEGLALASMAVIPSHQARGIGSTLVQEGAYNLMNEGDLAVERKDHERALRAYAGAEALVPGNAEMTYWHAFALVNMKRVDEALPLFAKVFQMYPNWKTLTPRLVAVGLIPDDREALRKILGEQPNPTKADR